MADSKSTRTDWTEIDVVRNHIEYAGEFVAQETKRLFLEATYGLLPPPSIVAVESPLEAIFWVWWGALTWGSDEHSTLGALRLEEQREVVAAGNAYRLDFVVTLYDPDDLREFEEAGRPFPLIAVELDGHAFHEKTPEQVTIRNSRDRALQQSGWLVFHFSWSEFTSNPIDKVAEIIMVAKAAYMECQRARAKKWSDDNPEALKRLHDALTKSKGDA